jgi:hypothetical protein
MITPTLRLATPTDDAALRQLLRDNPMPGNISLSYEREPSYFLAARVDGPLSQTIISVMPKPANCAAWARASSVRCI